MSRQGKVNPGMIGAFVLGAILLGLGAVFYLSDSGFGSQRLKFILYFEGDIKGLQVGAPVNFRGVKIGQVESMSITYEKKTQQFRIPVIISIDGNKVDFDGEEQVMEQVLDLQALIKQGLRARLNMQSLVTGKLEIDLGLEPDSEVRLVGKDNPYPEIPTVESSMEKLANAFEELPLERITRQISELLDSFDEIAAAGEIPKMIERFITISQRLEAVSVQLEQEMPKLFVSSQQTLDETRGLLRELTEATQETRQLLGRSGKQLDTAFANWNTTLASGEATFEQVRQVAESANQTVRQDSPMMTELNAALREMTAAARSLRVMSDYLQRHPEALLRGKQ